MAGGGPQGHEDCSLKRWILAARESLLMSFGGQPVNDVVSLEAQRLIEREERAHRIRMDILSRPGLLERLQAGREACERGKGLALEQLDDELAKLD